jgi:hypothetical protein
MSIMRIGRMRFARYGAFVKEMRNIYTILENLKGSSCWGELGMDGECYNFWMERTGFLRLWVVLTIGFI